MSKGLPKGSPFFFNAFFIIVARNIVINLLFKVWFVELPAKLIIECRKVRRF